MPTPSAPITSVAPPLPMLHAATHCTATGRHHGVACGGNRPQRLSSRVERDVADDLGAARVALDEIREFVRVPAENDAPRVGSFAQQRVELCSERFGPGNDERLDGTELKCGAGDQGAEIGWGSGEDTHAPFLKEGGRAGDAGDGVRTKLGGGGVGPECGLFMVRTHDHCSGIDQFPSLSRAFHRGREHQHDVPHTSLDCQRMLVFAQ